ncbi:DUF5947 family protein [Tengunoibacter tsumagoiensis]|uniref:Uncharacterized protein n=1 Tax=Tengunoibacter tsumagoiensis TaxID=2014871 RepID=A0A402A0W7_9CHLR|nr:DUF5947 family protein [Tengunoibacter tsumagoiensis]GCE12787.1 hypothetical protein KTT_26460 [Tengunoibacter tsumagoiensis]
MDSDLTNSYEYARASVSALRRFTQKRRPASAILEHCELCNSPLPPTHHHLMQLSNHEVLCTCTPCSLLFHPQGAGGEKYRLIPDRYLALVHFHITDEQWNDLQLPVQLAYLYRDSLAERMMAFYPSPAGAMEALLGLEQWAHLVEQNPILATLESDVEALLLNRVHGRTDYSIVPLDTCYQLVGLMRIHWRGLSGGSTVWAEIDAFFDRLHKKCELQSAESAI